MIRRILDLPFIVILMGIGSVAMYVPAGHAAAVRNYPVGRAFFYAGTLLLILTALIGIAAAANRPGSVARNHLLTLVAAFVLLPGMLAIPFAEAVPDTTFFNAWWEMVASFTTTGATLFEPARLPGSVHLWRALVGWLGGLFVLVTAVAVLAPMNLGGFEVLTGASGGQGAVSGGQNTRNIDTSERLVRYTASLLPIYGGLTLILWIALILPAMRISQE